MRRRPQNAPLCGSDAPAFPANVSPLPYSISTEALREIIGYLQPRLFQVLPNQFQSKLNRSPGCRGCWQLLRPCRRLSCLTLKVALSASVSSPVDPTPGLGNIRVLFEFSSLASYNSKDDVQFRLFSNAGSGDRGSSQGSSGGVHSHRHCDF